VPDEVRGDAGLIYREPDALSNLPAGPACRVMRFSRHWTKGWGRADRPTPIPHPPVTGLSLAGCSPAVPASVITGTAKIEERPNQHPGEMPTFNNPRT